MTLSRQQSRKNQRMRDKNAKLLVRLRDEGYIACYRCRGARQHIVEDVKTGRRKLVACDHCSGFGYLKPSSSAKARDKAAAELQKALKERLTSKE